MRLQNSESQNRNGTPRKAFGHLEDCAESRIVAVLFLMSLAVFSNALQNGFVYDDRVLIVSNLRLRDWDYVSTIFTHSFSYDFPSLNYSVMSIDYYRPFIRLLFWAEYQVFGLQPFYWHLLNAAVFGGTVALAYAVMRQISGRKTIAAIGAALFAAHPIHCEAAAWICGTVETLHALFFLGAFALYLRSDDERSESGNRIFQIGSCALFMAALFTKETALCFPILTAAHKFIKESGRMRIADCGLQIEEPKKPADFDERDEGFFSGNPQSAIRNLQSLVSAFKTSAPYLLVLAFYLIFRRTVYGGALKVDSNLPIETVLLTIPSVIAEYFRMFAWPVGLSTVHFVPLVESFSSWRFLLPVILLFAAGALILLKTSRAFIFACVSIIVTLSPALNIGMFAPHIMLQDRYAFLSSIGFCAVAAAAIVWLMEREVATVRLRAAAATLFAAMLIGLIGLTVKQNGYWQSDETLFGRAADCNPNSDFALCNYAATLYAAGNREEAALLFTKSFNIGKGESKCSCMGMAEYYAYKEDYNQAIRFYERALELGEWRLNKLVFTNLAYAYNANGERDKAVKLLSTALEIDPDFEEARNMLKNLSAKNGY